MQKLLEMSNKQNSILIPKDRFKLSNLKTNSMNETILMLRLSFKYNYLKQVDGIIKYIEKYSFIYLVNDAKKSNKVSLYNYYIVNKDYINNGCVSDVLCELTDDYDLLCYVLRKLPNLKSIDWNVINTAYIKKHYKSVELLKKRKMELDLKAYDYLL